MAHEYTQWPTLPHHHPQCPTLDTPQWLHTYEKCHTSTLTWGTMFHVKHLTQSHQYTQPYLYTITITTRGWKGVKPLRHKAHMKKGVHKGPCPWANPGKKKDNKLFFLLHNPFSHKGGFKGESSPLEEIETKSISLCLLASLCISLYLTASICFCPLCIWLYVCSFSTYTTTNLYNTTTNLNNHQPKQYNKYTMQPTQYKQ